MSSAQDVFQTTFDFVRPRGYVGAGGRVHQEGTMRLATARDELIPLLDPKVRENGAVVSLVLLARVVRKRGDVPAIDDQVMGGLWATDLAFLQDLYRQINSEGHTLIEVTCPSCSFDFAVDMAGDGPGE